MHIQIFLFEDFIVSVWNVIKQDSFQHCFLCSFLKQSLCLDLIYDMRQAFILTLHAKCQIFKNNFQVCIYVKKPCTVCIRPVAFSYQQQHCFLQDHCIQKCLYSYTISMYLCSSLEQVRIRLVCFCFNGVIGPVLQLHHCFTFFYCPLWQRAW